MIIPIKCFTCGQVLADKYRYYLDEDDVLIADKNITDIITIDDLDIENIIDDDYEDDYT